MARVLRTAVTPSTGEVTKLFDCPGCGQRHAVRTMPGANGGSTWGWNGSDERPTFTPSVLVRSGHYVTGPGSDCWCNLKQRTGRESPFRCVCCHSFVRDGMIEFLSDCTHELAGQTVPLPPVDD